MTRAAIYARFSTDLQNEKSTEDQIALCRAFAARESLEVVAAFEDKARSGGSVIGRDGLMQLMEAARDKAFDVLIVEALDRLSRDMEDLAGIHKRLTFLGIEIRAVHEGTVNTILVGLRGLMGQMFREDNAHKVRRGMRGRVREGLSGGGLTYGYEPAPGDRGHRRIVENEAETVRRIFREFVAGQTPRQITYALNRDGITPPRGLKWNASTLNGNVERGTGILRNPLYAGQLIWNRTRFVKDPDTGKRVSRINPESEWQVTPVPHLAIVEKELFDAAQKRKADRSKVQPEQQRRAKHLLSGLLRCGCCGSGLSSAGKDSSQRTRIRCSAARESGSCADPATFYLDSVESAVLTGLQAELRNPAVIAEYVKEFHEEKKRLTAKATANRSRAERRLGELDREIERLVDAIAKGLGDPAILGPRTTALDHERKEIHAELKSLPEAQNVLTLHPHVLERYEQQLVELQKTLAAGMSHGDSAAANAMRELVETVTVYRDRSRSAGFTVEIKGRLNALLGDTSFPNRIFGGIGGSGGGI